MNKGKGENVGEKVAEFYRVRHVMTGLYVGGYTLPDDAPGTVHTIELQLINRQNAWVKHRETAEMIANLWIALTGDHGIEIEPTEG